MYQNRYQKKTVAIMYVNYIMQFSLFFGAVSCFLTVSI